MGKQLTKHFSLEEVCNSSSATRLGINNYIDPQNNKQIYDCVLDTLKYVCEPIREYYGIPYSFNSFYRSSALNTAIGGSKTSDHCKGKAADIEIPSIHNIDLGIWCYYNLEFKQLIFEFVDVDSPRAGWIHISYDKNNNKGQVLFAKKNSLGKTYYESKSYEEMTDFIQKWNNNEF
jgi:hypothetical protein